MKINPRIKLAGIIAGSSSIGVVAGVAIDRLLLRPPEIKLPKQLITFTELGNAWHEWEVERAAGTFPSPQKWAIFIKTLYAWAFGVDIAPDDGGFLWWCGAEPQADAWERRGFVGFVYGFLTGARDRAPDVENWNKLPY